MSGRSTQPVDNIWSKYVGQQLRREREMLGISASKMSRWLGFHNDTLTKIEAGTHSANPQRLWKICSALEIDVADLLRDAMNATPEDLHRSTRGKTVNCTKCSVHECGLLACAVRDDAGYCEIHVGDWKPWM